MDYVDYGQKKLALESRVHVKIMFYVFLLPNVSYLQFDWNIDVVW